MAMVQAVRVEGFRNLECELRLAPKQLLRGRRGSGKSSVLDALRFAVLGYVPRLGKRPSDTARVIRDDVARVVVTLDDGRSFSRGLLRFKGETTTSVEASWAPRLDAHEAIVALFGESEEEAAEALDVRVLLEAPPAERTKRVEELLASAGPDQQAMIDRASCLAVLRLAGAEKLTLPRASDALRALAGATASTIEVPLREAARVAWGAVAPHVRSVGIPGAVEVAKVGKLNARARGKKAGEAVAAMAGAGPMLGAGAIAELRKTRDGLQAGLSAARERRGAEAAGEAARRREAAAREAVDAGGMLAMHATTKADLDALVVPAQPEPQPFTLPPEFEADQRALRGNAEIDDAEAARLEAEVGAAEVIPKAEPVPDVEAAAARAKRAREAFAALKGSAWGKAHDLARELGVQVVVSSAGLELCRAFDRLKAHITTQLGADPAMLEAEAARLEAQALEVGVAAEGAKARNAAALKGWTDRENARQAKAGKARVLRQRALAAREEVLAEEDKRREAHDQAQAAALDSWRSASALVNAKRASLAAREAKLVGEIQLRRSAVTKATTEREALEAAAAKHATANGDPDLLAVAFEKAQGELEAALTAVGRAEGAQQQRRELEAASCEERAYAAVEWALAKLRDELVGDRAGPVLALMAEVLFPAFPAGQAPTPYLRSGRGGPDFGWTAGGRDVPLATLSGGETALYMAAVASAVVRLRGPQVALLLVEGAELGNDESATAVLRALGAVADVQVIFASLVAGLEAPEPWASIELAAGKPAA